MKLSFKPVRTSRAEGFQGPYGGSQLVLTLFRMYFFCFQMCNRLPEMMKNGDAGIFPLYYSLNSYFTLIKAASCSGPQWFRDVCKFATDLRVRATKGSIIGARFGMNIRTKLTLPRTERCFQVNNGFNSVFTHANTVSGQNMPKVLNFLWSEVNFGWFQYQACCLKCAKHILK